MIDRDLADYGANPPPTPPAGPGDPPESPPDSTFGSKRSVNLGKT